MPAELMQSNVGGGGPTWRKDDGAVTSLKETTPSTATQSLGAQEEGTSKPSCINTLKLCPRLKARVGYGADRSWGVRGSGDLMLRHLYMPVHRAEDESPWFKPAMW